jgi:FAD:protein FMN transferase
MSATAVATASWEAIGTTALVRVSDRDHLELARRILRQELAEIDRAASGFRSDSELAGVLQADGRPVPVGDALRRAVRTALTAASLTDGLVDPTLGHHPGWREVELTDSTIRVPAGTPLDLGATGKALAADRAAAAISAATAGAGVLVSLGGDIATAGRGATGGWRVDGPE